MDCCRCFLPIHRDDAVDHLGDRVAHRHARCAELLRMRIAALEARLAASEAKCKELRESAKRAFEEQHDRTNECLKERAARAEAERLAVWAIEFDAWHSSATNRLHFGTGPSSGSNVPCDGTPAGILAALRQAEEATR